MSRRTAIWLVFAVSFVLVPHPAFADSGSVSTTAHPLVARYSFTSSRAGSVYVEFGEDTDYGRRTSAHTVAAGQPVDILVGGMKALTSYHMRAVVQYSDGSSGHDIDHVFTTAALAAGVPSFSAKQTGVVKEAGEGVELFDVVGAQTGPIVTDLDGNVVWYYLNPSSAGMSLPAKLLDDGNLLLGVGNELREIDLTGATVRSTSVAAINAELAAQQKPPIDSIHHDFALLPGGHVMLLTATTKVLPTLDNPAGTAVFDNGLLELDADWHVVWTWNAAEHLDINYHPWWGLPDWIHANAVLYDSRDHNLLFSSRHLNWLIKLDYRDRAGTGEVVWKLGHGGDFSLVDGGPADWFWAQHAPTFVSFDSQTSERLGVFDNGDYRTDDVGHTCGVRRPCYSRAVILAVDEAARTAHVQWEDKLSAYSAWGGSIDQLRNGTVEFALTSVFPTTHGRVMEVTEDAVPQKVSQFDTSQYVYRGRRIPSLYPGVSW